MEEELVIDIDIAATESAINKYRAVVCEVESLRETCSDSSLNSAAKSLGLTFFDEFYEFGETEAERHQPFYEGALNYTASLSNIQTNMKPTDGAELDLKAVTAAGDGGGHVDKVSGGSGQEDLISGIDEAGLDASLVVGSDTGSLKDLIDEIGAADDELNKVDAGDASAIAAALLGLIAEPPKLGATELTDSQRDFILTRLTEITGLSIEELLSGKHNDELMSAFQQVQNEISALGKAGDMSEEEFMRAISGDPAVIADMSTEEREEFLRFIVTGASSSGVLATLLNNFNPEVINSIASNGDALTSIEGLSGNELVNALKGLNSPNPNLNGISITEEGRDYINQRLAEIAKDNGLTLEELLDGSHNDLLEKSMKQISNEMKNMDSLSKLTPEELGELQERISLGYYTEECGITPVTAKTFMEELNEIATNNGITVEELLNDPQYASLLASSIGNISANSELINAISNLSGNELQSTLSGILNGSIDNVNGLMINATGKDFISDYLNAIAAKNNITVDELLNNPKYASLLKDAMGDLDNYSTWLKSIEGKDNIQQIISDMVSGNNHRLLGIPDNELKSLYSIIERFAKANNVSIEELMKNKDLYDALLENMRVSGSFNNYSYLFGTENSEELISTISNLNKSVDESNHEGISNLVEYVSQMDKKTLGEIGSAGGLLGVAAVNKLRDLLSSNKNKDIQNEIDIILNEQINLIEYKSLLTFLEIVCKNNNISLDDLLNNPLYKDLLNDSLNDYIIMEPIILELLKINKDDLPFILLKIVMGDLKEIGAYQIGDNMRLIFASKIKTISELLGINSNELIINPNYKDLIYKLVESYNGTIDYIKNNSISNIYNGIDYKILGIKDEQLVSLKQSVNNYFVNNNVTFEQVVSDDNYNASLVNELNNNDNYYPYKYVFGNRSNKEQLEILNNSLKQVNDSNQVNSDMVNTLVGLGAVEVIKIFNRVYIERNNDGLSRYLLTFMEYIAKEKMISVDKLLRDEKYVPLLNSIFKNSSLALKDLGNNVDDDIVLTNFIINIIYLKTPKYLGYQVNNNDFIIKMLSNLAIANNVNLDILLTNSLYKENIKKELLSSNDKVLIGLLEDKNSDYIQRCLMNYYLSMKGGI